MQCAEDDGESRTAVFVATFPMPGDLTFDWHTHSDHQLAWAAAGVLIVRTGTATWTLPPSRALWIPAGLRHETLSAGTATMRTLYIRPELCPISWPDFTPVAASPLLAELIGYLAEPELEAGRRQHAETLVVDLLQPVPMTAIEVRIPDDERARQVADALVDDPADGRSLAQWGRVVGASERTLARAFVVGTGLPFGRWRTLLRVQSAISALAAGEPVGNVSRRVGYESPSAFVAAFRREIGVTPARYFGGPPHQPD
ncbi:MAG TPA: helix-turn-helix transcriptional regulator [Streptosporangiaceae bacterium]|nr:helix-turn-helix transcriptional regulator [Streptosporangiaceae bacterium]